MRAVLTLALCAWSALACAQYDESGDESGSECQQAKAQEKSARSDLLPALNQYQACVHKAGDESCSPEFEHLRIAQTSYREAVEHRQQTCAY